MPHLSNATLAPVADDAIDQHLCLWVRMDNAELSKQLYRCTSNRRVAGGESKLSYSIDKRAAEMVIYCYLLTTSRQLCDFQAALWRAYLPLSTDVLHQNSGTP